MNRRSFIKTLAALSSGIALPSFAVPIVDAPHEVAADEKYAISWERAFDPYKALFVFRLNVRFENDNYFVTAYETEGALGQETKKIMEQNMAQHVLKEKGIDIQSSL